MYNKLSDTRQKTQQRIFLLHFLLSYCIPHEIGVILIQLEAFLWDVWKHSDHQAALDLQVAPENTHFIRCGA